VATQISSHRDAIRNLAAWRRISRKMIAADRYRPRQPIKNFEVLLEGGTHPLLARTSWWSKAEITGAGKWARSRACVVELRGFEPLTSAVQVPRSADVAPLPFLQGFDTEDTAGT
jgi:hypothetical protein